ncbi:hypothetical protein BC938DRAFT_477919 [Jimgerdemannia flammicorona]|uniref:Uncharacterized protein n=1 Tax=Jimgerdemannia flammicorona TaxID=994334 RepID=A0A433QYN7_9FUNG|nr:hypothetical protein BC938DRAFT_477919 [Jimgerdemannia flammicorona]
MCPEGKLSATDETCPACRLPVDLTRRVKSETQANRLLQSGNIDSVRKCLDIQQQLYCADAHVLGATYDRLAELYARKGNFCESVSYCRKSIDVVRARFGSQSPELAREMFKLCTLLFNRYVSTVLASFGHTHRLFYWVVYIGSFRISGNSQRLQEALATIRATLVLYKNHGLSHEDDVQELIGMKRFLETL